MDGNVGEKVAVSKNLQNELQAQFNKIDTLDMDFKKKSAMGTNNSDSQTIIEVNQGVLNIGWAVKHGYFTITEDIPNSEQVIDEYGVTVKFG